jgi:hypothetical protein
MGQLPVGNFQARGPERAPPPLKVPVRLTLAKGTESIPQDPLLGWERLVQVRPRRARLQRQVRRLDSVGRLLPAVSMSAPVKEPKGQLRPSFSEISPNHAPQNAVFLNSRLLIRSLALSQNLRLPQQLHRPEGRNRKLLNRCLVCQTDPQKKFHILRKSIE